MPQLNRAPVASVRIQAHTDTVGTPEENQARTEQWAAAMQAYIVNATGLDPSQVTTEAYGDTRPVVATDDEVDEPRNRRIELKLTER